MVEELKMEYNFTLNRYYDGCNYLESHPEEFDKYVNEVIKLKNKIDNLLGKIMKVQQVTENEILEGFNL